jgi:hypothetical protein
MKLQSHFTLSNRFGAHILVRGMSAVNRLPAFAGTSNNMKAKDFVSRRVASAVTYTSNHRCFEPLEGE